MLFRSRKKDHSAVIIFITSHAEKIQQAFEVSAFNFLVKPLNKERAKQIICKAVDHISENNDFFQYKKDLVEVTVPFAEMEAVSFSRKSITLYTKTSSVNSYRVNC